MNKALKFKLITLIIMLSFSSLHAQANTKVTANTIQQAKEIKEKITNELLMATKIQKQQSYQKFNFDSNGLAQYFATRIPTSKKLANTLTTNYATYTFFGSTTGHCNETNKCTVRIDMHKNPALYFQYKRILLLKETQNGLIEINTNDIQEFSK